MTDEVFFIVVGGKICGCVRLMLNCVLGIVQDSLFHKSTKCDVGDNNSNNNSTQVMQY